MSTTSQTAAPPAKRGVRFHSSIPAVSRSTHPTRDWLAVAIWGMFAIALVARLLRFALRFPLWGDECLLATNFIDRGFIELTRPLDNHQVAPVAFLWIEEASTRLFGFTEYSLRLWPLLAGVGALLLLLRFAWCELPPLAALFAVGFFGASSYAIRHAVEVKPYSSDSLVTMLLLTAAWPVVQSATADWRRLCGLAFLAGLGILIAYPSIFVVAAVGLITLPSVSRARRWSAWAAYVAFGVAVGAAFSLVFATSIGPQFDAEHAVMREYWADAFPPIAEPWRLPLWLLDAHTGEMFAYPLGGEKGGSALTFACFVLGIIAVWRTPARPLALVALATLAFALIAAAVGRYPYGGHPRLVQYVAPLICLLAGSGLARILSPDRPTALAVRLRFAAVAAFVIIGFGLMANYVVRPYQDVRDVERRNVVIDLWRDLAVSPGLVLSLHDDLNVELYPESQPTIGRIMYRCNEQIYGQRSSGPWSKIHSRIACEAPLRCIAHHIMEDIGDARVRAVWLSTLVNQHHLTVRATQSIRAETPVSDAYEIFEVVPVNCMSAGSAAQRNES